MRVLQRLKDSRLNITSKWSMEKKAFWSLMLLSPMVGELCSGSCPPLEFFNPFTLLFLVALYGAGAVLIRETAIRWNKGWGAILLMAAAYGIVEEGLAVKSWFDPNWMDLGILGIYGRWMGTNTVWAVWLTMFHMIMSIVVPIMLINLIFPQLRGKRITDDKTYRNLIIIIVLDCILIFGALNPYIPPAGPYILAFAATAFLVYLAFRLPADWGLRRQGLPDWSPARFWLLGTSLMFWSFIMYGGGGFFIPHPLQLVALTSFGGLICLYLVLEHMGTVANGRHMVAFVAGLFSWLIFIDLVLWPVLLPPVGIVTAICLYKLYKNVSAREASQNVVVPAAPPSAPAPAPTGVVA